MNRLKKSDSVGFDRAQALAGIPEQLPYLEKRDLPDGGLEIRVKLRRAGWTRWLGAPEEMEKSFQLDYLGREVYEACDGEKSTQELIRDFASSHQISLPEAEYSVTTYLKTLMARALIGVAMPRPTPSTAGEDRS